MSTQATKRRCACGCGVILRSTSQDDMAWSCRDRQIKAGELPEHDPRGAKPKKRPNVYNREILTRLLVEWSERHDGRTPLASEMKIPEIPSRTTYKLHFGSWCAAVKSAGLTPNVSAAMVNRPGTHRVLFLSLLREKPLTANQAAEVLGRDPKRVFRLIDRLRKDGEVVVVGKVVQEYPHRPVSVNLYGLAKR